MLVSRTVGDGEVRVQESKLVKRPQHVPHCAVKLESGLEVCGRWPLRLATTEAHLDRLLPSPRRCRTIVG